MYGFVNFPLIAGSQESELYLYDSDSFPSGARPAGSPVDPVQQRQTWGRKTPGFGWATFGSCLVGGSDKYRHI